MTTTQTDDRIGRVLDELENAVRAGNGAGMKVGADSLGGLLSGGSQRTLIELRLQAGTPLSEVIDSEGPFLALTRADLRTVEEVAAVPRKDVVAIRNVGALTMERLDRALAALGLAYVGAVA
jgi:hypothetical protein